MQFSAPIFRLKRRARLLSRSASIPLNQALDRIARAEGAGSWSALTARLAASRPTSRILSALQPGELVLLAARPGQGKTLLALELLLEAAKHKREACFFTLEWSEQETRSRLEQLQGEDAALSRRVRIDASDAICADHVIDRMRHAPRGSLVIIDYLQLLDQDRRKPGIGDQLAALGEFATSSGITFILLSQVDRRYDPATRPVPDVGDIRMPNPVPLALFSRACFLHDGEIRLDPAAA